MANKYHKNKEKLRKKAHERFQNLSEEEKEKKHQYHRERNFRISKGILAYKK